MLKETIEHICKSTENTYSAEHAVKEAFLFGLWWRQFPEYMIKNLESTYCWDFYNIDPDCKSWGASARLYPYGFKFNFIADTRDSWHQLYRDIRAHGWKRLKVHREGGKLQYLFEITRDGMPEGYSTLHLLLNITIATCRQVVERYETKEVPIMKTVCDDLIEVEDPAEVDRISKYAYPTELPAAPPPEPESTELIGISGVEGEGQFNPAEFLKDEDGTEVEPEVNTAEYEAVYGPEGQVDQVMTEGIKVPGAPDGAEPMTGTVSSSNDNKSFEDSIPF